MARSKSTKRPAVETVSGIIRLRPGQRRDGALLAIRKYAGAKAGNPWLLASRSRVSRRGFVLTHSSARAAGTKFAFSPGSAPGELTFRVYGGKAALSASLIVTAIVNTELSEIAESVEVKTPE